MNATQARQFIDLGVDRAVLVKDSSIVEMDAPTMDIGTLTVDGLAGTIGADTDYTAVAAAERSVPSFSGSTLTSGEFVLQGRISKAWVESNIAKEEGRRQVHQAFSRGFMWALENAGWRGDTAGSNPSGWGNRLGTKINGWRKLQSTYTVDHGGGVPNRLLFHNCILQLPTKYRDEGWEDRFVFYVHPDVVQYYKYILEARETNAGDGFLLSKGTVSFRGVKLVPAACLQANMTGVGLATGLGDDCTEILLCEPKNKVVGYHADISVYRATDFDGRIEYITYRARFAVGFYNETATVYGWNIKTAVS
jgi:hypothetical protein